ncbi:hypothetical protein KXV85_003964, partial [Aspergillus fumigatus]
SHHISASLKYLPQVARQLYHCRDLGEPFDFLTWFEYAPEHAPQFEELVATLRDTEEWTFVEREKFSRIDARQLFDRPVVDIGPGIARAAVFQRDGKHLPQIFGRRRKAFAAGLIHVELEQHLARGTQAVELAMDDVGGIFREHEAGIVLYEIKPAATARLADKIG